MPSSSTGTTVIEKDLTAHFRRVFIHLRLSARREELDYLIDKFADTLDLTETQVHILLYPSALPLHERAKHHVDIEVLDQLRRVSRAMKLPDRICEAGNACSDMGWLLKRVGRKEEGERWCEFDRLLTIVAWRVDDEEKNANFAVEEEREGARLRVQAQARRREVIELD